MARCGVVLRMRHKPALPVLSMLPVWVPIARLLSVHVPTALVIAPATVTIHHAHTSAHINAAAHITHPEVGI